MDGLFVLAFLFMFISSIATVLKEANKKKQNELLNKKVDDEAIRSPKDYNVDLSELSCCIEKNKEKIESIEYIIDDELVLSENKQVKTLEEIMKDIKVRKINL